MYIFFIHVGHTSCVRAHKMRFKLCQKSRRDISMGYIATYNDYAFNGLRVFQYGIRITENRQRSFAIKVVKITTKHTWKVRSSTFYLRVYRSYCSADFTNQGFKDQPAIRCIQIKEYWCHLNNLGYLDAGYRVKRCDLMKSGGETAYCLNEMMIKLTRTYHFSNRRQPFGNNSPIIVFFAKQTTFDYLTFEYLVTIQWSVVGYISAFYCFPGLECVEEAHYFTKMQIYLWTLYRYVYFKILK